MGIRPSRKSGVRVEKELRNGQKIVHAYGTFKNIFSEPLERPLCLTSPFPPKVLLLVATYSASESHAQLGISSRSTCFLSQQLDCEILLETTGPRKGNDLFLGSHLCRMMNESVEMDDGNYR